MDSDKNKSQVDLEWENRVLCSDEACIGTIGPNGRCRECGLPFEGELPDSLAQVPAGTDKEGLLSVDTAEQSRGPQNDPIQDDADLLTEETDQLSMDPGDDEWARRRLCSDEACIGTIGPDGLCKECGRSSDD